MFTKHLHYTAIGREIVVVRENVRHVTSLGDFKYVLPTIGVVLVRAEHAEIATLEIQLHDVAQEFALHSRGFGRNGTVTWHVDRIFAEIRHTQVLEEQSAVGMRIITHPPMAGWGQRCKL